MYRAGHYGAALLVYAPLSAAVALAGYEALAVVGGAVAVALSTTPDYDHRVPLIAHRGPTHTLLFALVVGAVLAAVAAVAATEEAPVEAPILATFAFTVGTLSIGSHLLADWLTPMGIRPFWPVSSRRYSLSVTTAANPVSNSLLLAAGVGTAFLAAASVSTV
ncbi:metal-dependent hydrolase [Saliphagus infecundisoli]|uniref:Metal-dependent hydrolase n=1 Tax=Saliphagus infecundisoli TaxID=1849069 RepID=A0ABD5QEP7_9EURY|nr:metal-dependent hydrolase [Saliphagus infecundisoli]